MRLATAFTPSMSSDSPLTGPRHSVVPPLIPILMVTRPPSSRCTAETGNTMKWIAAQLPASTRLWPMSDWPTMGLCDKCCTTTSRGRPRQRCPATTTPPMTCRTASPSHTGHGTDSRSKPPGLTTVRPRISINFARRWAVRRLMCSIVGSLLAAMFRTQSFRRECRILFRFSIGSAQRSRNLTHEGIEAVKLTEQSVPFLNSLTPRARDEPVAPPPTLRPPLTPRASRSTRAHPPPRKFAARSSRTDTAAS